VSASLIRAFFAIDLPPECQRQLGFFMEALQLHLKKILKQHSAFRWVQPQNVHLTLQFLGQLKPEDAAELLREASRQLAGLQPFSLRLGHLEWFPSPYRPHVLSLHAQPDVALAELSQALGRAALALGYAIEDRPFRAHLTLARIEDQRNLEPQLLHAFSWEELPDVLVNEVVLFRSETLSGGSVYTRLARLKMNNPE
jgi:2'-5' RNA ligase